MPAWANICYLVTHAAQPSAEDISYTPRVRLPDGNFGFRSLLLPEPGQEHGQKRLGVAILTNKGRVVYVITRYILSDHELAKSYLEMIMRIHLPADEKVTKYYWGGETSTRSEGLPENHVQLTFINPTSGMMTRLVNPATENLSGTFKTLLLAHLPGLAEHAFAGDYSAEHAHIDAYMSDWVRSEYANREKTGKSFYQLVNEHQDKELELEAKIDALEKEVNLADNDSVDVEPGSLEEARYDQEIDRLNKASNALKRELGSLKQNRPKPPNYRHDVWLNGINPISTALTILSMEGIGSDFRGEALNIIARGSGPVLQHLRLLKEDGAKFFDQAGQPYDAIAIATEQLILATDPQRHADVDATALRDSLGLIIDLDRNVREPLVAGKAHPLDDHVEIIQLRGRIVPETIQVETYQKPEGKAP